MSFSLSSHTLFLDAGNSRIKAAVKEGKEWRLVAILAERGDALKEKLITICKPFRQIVLSSVRNTLSPGLLSEWVSAEVHGVETGALPASQMGYLTVNTLGADRYLACLGAWHLCRSDVIVSDSGTACTIDFMNKEGVFLGGVIMPGLQMMISSLDKSAEGLFSVTPDLFAEWPPDTTEKALQAGTAGTFLAAWTAHVDRSLKKYPEAGLWITGGAAGFLMKHSPFSCIHHEYLVFEGMYQWALTQKS